MEGVHWQRVSAQPAHLLSRRFSSWDALLNDAAQEVLDSPDVTASGQPRPWGERNTAAICHPLAKALPGCVRTKLCMQFDPLPGDNNLPRTIGRAHVCTPVTNAHFVCRHLLDKKKRSTQERKIQRKHKHN